MWNGILFIVLLIVQLISYLTSHKPSSLSLLGNSFQGIALVLAAIQFTRVARRAKESEIRFRNLLALGLWIWVMGHGLLSYSELLLKMPATGTVADAIWLIGYVLFSLGIYVMLSQLLKKKNMRKLTVILLPMITAIVLIALWPVFVDPERSVLVKFIQIIFPMMDFCIASMAYFVARRSGDKRWLLGAVGSTIIGLVDLIFPYFDILTLPIYRYMDIPLFIGYSMWWLLGAQLAEEAKDRSTPVAEAADLSPQNYN
jgi:hypothetical protein